MDICRVFVEDPELAVGIDASAKECVVRAFRLPSGRWAGELTASVSRGIGLLVLEGLLLRRVGIDGRYGAELLGEGDLIRPWQGEGARPALRRTTGWQVLKPTRLAVLDENAERQFAAYPELTGRLVYVTGVPLPTDSPSGDGPAADLCRDFTCRQPVTSAAELVHLGRH